METVQFPNSPTAPTAPRHVKLASVTPTIGAVPATTSFSAAAKTFGCGAFSPKAVVATRLQQRNSAAQLSCNAFGVSVEYNTVSI